MVGKVNEGRKENSSSEGKVSHPDRVSRGKSITTYRPDGFCKIRRRKGKMGLGI